MTLAETVSDGGGDRRHLDVVARVRADVDAVLGRPVVEHVKVFADAHEQLRGALNLDTTV